MQTFADASTFGRVTSQMHLALVRRAIMGAAWLLMISLLAQLFLNLDFRGLPFLLFGLAVAVVALSLPVASLLKRPQG